MAAAATTTTTATKSTSVYFNAIIGKGSDGERVLRGFLFGVIIGLAVAILACCWLPCMRRTRRTEREQMALMRERAEEQQRQRQRQAR
jgi:hypothetical protein